MVYKNWYDILISPLLSGLTRRVVAQIEHGANVLEVGCGTGELASALLQKGINSYVGVDLNSKMIKAARGKVDHPNFEFIADDFLNIQVGSKFDYAIFPMIIHSIDKQLAIALLTKACSVARVIIIADYLVPQPRNYKGMLVLLIERLAGVEHFRNFQRFKVMGGAKYYASNIPSHIIHRAEYEVFNILSLSVL
jgi:16S rRNA A1518/A1519 N6-dimethyltransferase RsmA/KsgA/DIM1 with predicted DNA glycosylase/AP lyase activity